MLETQTENYRTSIFDPLCGLCMNPIAVRYSDEEPVDLGTQWAHQRCVDALDRCPCCNEPVPPNDALEDFEAQKWHQDCARSLVGADDTTPNHIVCDRLLAMEKENDDG